MAQALREVLASFDPDLATGADCALVAEELARTEMACAGARARAATRAIKAAQHRARGFADGADWVANRMGAAVGAARAELEAAAAIKESGRHAGGVGGRRGGLSPRGPGSPGRSGRSRLGGGFA
jgi:hypothetical protein